MQYKLKSLLVPIPVSRVVSSAGLFLRIGFYTMTTKARFGIRPAVRHGEISDGRRSEGGGSAPDEEVGKALSSSRVMPEPNVELNPNSGDSDATEKKNTRHD